MDELSDNSTLKNSRNLSPPTGEGIVIDIGTGDGRFVYQWARQNPRKFYIGIDPIVRPLEKISERIYRSRAKGGLPNALFIQATIENLPRELYGLANEVHIHFPWGSLLRAVVIGDESVLRSLRRICADDALLEILIGLDPNRDQAEMTRLALPAMTEEYLAIELVPRYQATGFRVLETGLLSPANWPELGSTWAKRLRGSTSRNLIYLVAQATATGG